jgi:hypothetical protein
MSFIYSTANYITVQVDSLSSNRDILSIIVTGHIISSICTVKGTITVIYIELDMVVYYLINDGLMASPRIFSHVTSSCFSDKGMIVPVSPLTLSNSRCLHYQASFRFLY